MATLIHITIGIICLVCFFGATFSTKFLLTVPKELHFDSEVIATVTAVGMRPGRAEDVYLTYKGAKDRSRTLNVTRLTFYRDGVQTWGVVFSWDRILSVDETGVELEMATNTATESKKLYFSKSTGFIFIQTDKPIYTPRETVKFRIIAVDENQKLAKYQLKVDIKNDKFIIVDRMRYSAEDAFKGQEFELPREANPGVWTISANFEGLYHTYSATKSATFEIKEYVLPRFSAELDIDTDVITKDSHWVSLTVTANYVYGRPVMGTAEMQLGIWDETKGISLLPAKFSGELKNGEFKQDVRTQTLFPANLEFPEGRRLYVNVNVTESATQENDTIEDTSVFIAHPYYVVTFDDTKSHFRPGFPFTVKANVRAKSGTPASWVYVYITATFVGVFGEEVGKEYKYQRLDEMGKLSMDLAVPERTDEVQITALVVDFKRANLKGATLTVPKLRSVNDEYLHISLMQPVEESRDGVALIQYTKPPRNTATYSTITFLILANGKVVHSNSLVRNTDGRSEMKIPRRLYSLVSPRMRLVAYYHIDGEFPEDVGDSLLVKTDEACLEEVILKRPGGIFGGAKEYKPKEKYPMEVVGGPYMKLGFVAVDKAVFLISDKQTLTRDLLFDQLGSHDLGKGEGDGDTVEEMLQNSGLVLIMIDTTRSSRTQTSHVVAPVGLPGISLPDGFPGLPPFDKNVDVIDPRKHIDKQIQIPSTLTPPQTIRKYFPQSWSFDEITLPRSGRHTMNLTLPDSITTWSFMAVGVSSLRGVCVSKPSELEVQKLFFVDVRIPYKVTRLEEVKVKIAIYNYQLYDIDVDVVVTGSDGICFSANSQRGSTQNATSFKEKLKSKGFASRVIKVIPLKNGDLKLRVDVSNNRERDIVERPIHVVAEGLRIRKSITFVLDPEATHASYKAQRGGTITHTKTATINNIFDLRKKEQQTTIDLSLPQEVIRGTELCRISAFGDLMGDIITHAIVQSRSLVDQPVSDAEEVLGDLGPTVHALLYANQSGLMNAELTQRGRRFIVHSVARLMKYHKVNYFTLTPGSKPATWLTSVVLKTLCHASRLAFVDKENLIDTGFYWLLQQEDVNGTLKEEDLRLADDSFEYKIMLSAEVLIAIYECERFDKERHLTLETKMALFIEDNLQIIQQPLVLAKAAYALMLYDTVSESTKDAVERLQALKRRNKLGHIYWSDQEETDEARKVPFWYHSGAKASSIEGTAFALMVFLEKGGMNVDAIADWLVSQRNPNGAFIGAMDSMAAIQALSMYSNLKHGLEVNLSCNVGSDRLHDYTHSFKFTLQNATRPELVNDVPVGQSLQVLTKGHGLGQMQVNVEYNVPIEKNKHCSFNVTVEVKSTQIRWMEDMESYPLCTSCNIGCPPPKPKNDTNSTDTEDPERALDPIHGGVLMMPLPNPESRRNVPTNSRDRSIRTQYTQTDTAGTTVYDRKTSARERMAARRRERQRQREERRRNRNRNRKTRSARHSPASSKKSICMHVCLKYLESGVSGPTSIEIEMLSGYRPVVSDVERIKNLTGVSHVEYQTQRDVLVVQYRMIPSKEKSCFAFRAVDEEEVGRPTPATVLIKEVGMPYPSCALDYNPVAGEESLRVYCADFSHINRGECRCYSGICSSCTQSDNDLHKTKQMVCESDVGYQLQMVNVKDQIQWVEIDARVVSLNKTASHRLRPNQIIKLMSPSSCYCPVYDFTKKNEKFYMLSADVETLVDRLGNRVERYLLDESSFFLRTTDPGRIASTSPAVPFIYLQEAFGPNNRCSA